MQIIHGLFLIFVIVALLFVRLFEGIFVVIGTSAHSWAGEGIGVVGIVRGCIRLALNVLNAIRRPLGRYCEDYHPNVANVIRPLIMERRRRID